MESPLISSRSIRTKDARFCELKLREITVGDRPYRSISPRGLLHPVHTPPAPYNVSKPSEKALRVFVRTAELSGAEQLIGTK